ncbi:DUF4215 domain-containing protein, partial [Candidatus Woesearchaeota archaeon]|nr:DUF4215 domain-containing protein [Candidatus Woesearchaeota archaeon]
MDKKKNRLFRNKLIARFLLFAVVFALSIVFAAGVEAACVDTDGGKDYYVAGAAGPPPPESGPGAYDCCKQSYLGTCESGGQWLHEAYCSGGHATFEEIRCAYGCRDGACLRVPKTPVCGDWIQDTGEECDDGNTDNYDACRNDCTLPYCGDGIKDAREQCDDGNTNNLDSCRNNCKFPYCGDGIIDAGEECDDGNGINMDGCSADCKTEAEQCTKVEYSPNYGKDTTSYHAYILTSSDLGKLALSDDSRYGTHDYWPQTGYSINEYLLFEFPFDMEECETIRSVKLYFEWYSYVYDPAKIMVWDQGTSSWVTHTLPYPPSIDRTDVIDLSSYITTADEVNNIQIKFQAYSTYAYWYTYHDLVKLVVEKCGCPSVCGDGVKDPGEQCELPQTNNNQYCSQTTEQCSGTKLGTRDAYGYCDDECGCLPDSFTYQCVKDECGAACDSNDDCSPNYCATVYTDYCYGKKLADYNNNKLYDSYTKTDSCGNTCNLGTCGCSNCQPDCSATPTKQCVAGICGAECDSNDDCSDYNPNTIDTCNLGNCMCEHEQQPYCGDGNIDTGEECDDGINNGAQCTPPYGGSCTYCSETCEEITLTDGYCGDGILQTLYEECEADGQWGDGHEFTCNQDNTYNECVDCEYEPVNECSYYCSGSSQCDGVPPNTFLEECGYGYNYLEDYCDENCEIQDDNCESDYTGCTADPECDEENPFAPSNPYCTYQCDYKPPYCGDGIINGDEQCEPPEDDNNEYCSQTTEQCSGTKLGTRDAYGYCDQSCGCLPDSFTYACVKDECGAACDSNDDCSPNNCEIVYDDYCDGKKLADYNGNDIYDSHTETGSCDNTCDLNDCGCSNCQPDCSAEPQLGCVIGVCDAECAVDVDCPEKCTSTSHKLYNFIGCNDCGCDYSGYQCVVGKCGAECDEDTDCSCQDDHCDGTTWVDYPDYGMCGTAGEEGCLCQVDTGAGG